MRISFLTTLATPGHTYQMGKSYDVEDAEAQRLIKAGIARMVAEKSHAPATADKAPAPVKADSKKGTPAEDKATLLPPVHKPEFYRRLEAEKAAEKAVEKK